MTNFLHKPKLFFLFFFENNTKSNLSNEWFCSVTSTNEINVFFAGKSSEMKRKEWSERLHQINLYFSKKWEFLLNLWRKSRITFDSFLKRKFFFCFVFENILSLLPEKSFQTQKRNIIVPTILFSLPLSKKKKEKKTIRNQIILFFTQRRKYDIPWMSGSGGSSLLTVAKIGCFDVDLSCELMRCWGWFAQRSAVSLIHDIYIYIYTIDSIPRMTENEKSEFFEPKNQRNC